MCWMVVNVGFERDELGVRNPHPFMRPLNDTMFPDLRSAMLAYAGVWEAINRGILGRKDKPSSRDYADYPIILWNIHEPQDNIVVTYGANIPELSEGVKDDLAYILDESDAGWSAQLYDQFGPMIDEAGMPTRLAFDTVVIPNEPSQPGTDTDENIDPDNPPFTDEEMIQVTSAMRDPEFSYYTYHSELTLRLAQFEDEDKKDQQATRIAKSNESHSPGYAPTAPVSRSKGLSPSLGVIVPSGIPKPSEGRIERPGLKPRFSD